MSFYPRRNVDNRGGWFPSIFGMNPFNMMPSAMSDIFDPINLDIDRLLDRSLHWINVPTGRQQQQQTRQRQMPRQQQSVQQKQQRQQQLPKHLQQQQQQTRMQQTQQQQVLGKMPQKFRILIDCSSCNPKSLKTHIKTVNEQKHLIVCADEQKGKKCEPSYICKQFKRTYTLPKQVDVNKMISFVTPNGQFVVEFPLQEVVCCLDIDMVPKIEKTPQGRVVSLRVPIPLNVDPAKVTLTVKGRDVILRFEDRFGTEDCVSRVYFYNRCTLPESADLNKIKCCADKHRLIITAPLRTDVTTWQSREIPIQRKIRHKTLLATTGGISGQKQSTQQKNKNVLSSSSSKVTSRSKSPITTEQQQKKSSIKTDQKPPIKSEQQKQKSPIKDTTQQTSTGIGKKQKKSTTGETGSDILKSVFGSGSQTEKKQKSKSSGDVKSDFPSLPTDGKQSESHHQQI